MSCSYHAVVMYRNTIKKCTGKIFGYLCNTINDNYSALMTVWTIISGNHISIHRKCEIFQMS